MSGATVASICSVDLNMGTISGTTHIKMVLSFSPCLGCISLVKHSVALTILHAPQSHFALFHDKKYLLQLPKRKNPEESNLENEGAREWVFLSLSNEQDKAEKNGSYDTK
jgi:hypothetical protein